MKQIRIDLYYGWTTDEGPTDREQRFFNPMTDDLDEFIKEVNMALEDSIASLVNEEGDEDVTADELIGVHRD